MKTHKLLSMVLVLSLMLSICAISAYALEYPSSDSATCPYSSANVNIAVNWIGDDTATATITACSCNPMENYLMASLKIQYQDGDNKYWSPESGTSYYYSSDNDTTKESMPLKAAKITYAKGWFAAECYSNGNNEKLDFFLEDEP